MSNKDKNFQDIYNLYKNDVLRLAYSYTKDITDAEDVMQSVFIKLYENMEELENYDRIKHWCLKVTVNHCKNLCLSFWKRNILLNSEKDGIANSFTDDDLVREAILSLPKKSRVIIYLYYFEGFKVKEIAEIMNSNTSSIQTILNRGRIKLKTILEKELD